MSPSPVILERHCPYALLSQSDLDDEGVTSSDQGGQEHLRVRVIGPLSRAQTPSLVELALAVISIGVFALVAWAVLG